MTKLPKELQANEMALIFSDDGNKSIVKLAIPTAILHDQQSGKENKISIDPEKINHTQVVGLEMLHCFNLFSSLLEGGVNVEDVLEKVCAMHVAGTLKFIIDSVDNIDKGTLH